MWYNLMVPLVYFHDSIANLIKSDLLVLQDYMFLSNFIKSDVIQNNMLGSI